MIFRSHQGLLEGTFWSLFVEVKFYIIFGLIFFSFGESVAISSLIGWFVISILRGHGLGAIMIWFASGAIYYLYFKSSKKKWLWMGLTISLVGSVSLYYFHRGIGAMLIAIIMSLFFLTVMMSEKMRLIVGSRFLLFFGFISYPLYLIHENMMVSLIIKFGHWMPFMSGFLLPFVPIAFVVFISWLLAKFAEPGFRNILRGILEERKKAKLEVSHEKIV